MKKFTEKEFEKQLQKTWKELVINNNITKSDEPQAYIIGGEPGAGKSTLVDRLMESNKNIMSIDADVCKTFHPRYNTIMKKYPDQAHDMLKDFSAKLKDTITDKTLKEYFNVLIESIFRDPNVPIKILNELKNMDIKGIF